MENNQNMKALFIIVNAGFADAAVELAQSCGAGGATILSARGSGAKYSSFLVFNMSQKEKFLSVLSLAKSQTKSLMPSHKN